MCEGTIATKFEEASGDMAEITKAKTLLKHHRIIHRQGVDRCWNLMESPDKPYKCATAIGYEFDSTFQTLHGIPRRQCVLKNGRQDHLINSKALDDVFPETIVAQTKGAIESSSTMIPSRL